MSGPSGDKGKIIESKKDLVEWFAAGCTPADQLKFGVEHEKPPFYIVDNAPVSYEGKMGRAGVGDFFNALVATGSWKPGTVENGKMIDIHQDDGGNYTLEPAAQIENGGVPYQSVHDTAKETLRLIREGASVADALGFRMVATGFNPTQRSATLPVMEKSRYKVYRDHVAAQGITAPADILGRAQDGFDVIACTSTAQYNTGFSSEADFVTKMRVSLNASSAVIAMFATSPFADGAPSGFNSYRNHVNDHAWNGRFGSPLPVAFESGFGFERYTDFVLQNMPVIGIYEGHEFKSAHSRLFTDFMQAKLDAAPGRFAAMGDWSDFLNTIWPDTRPRKFLEMRSADTGPAEMITGLTAFWTGLLFDQTALKDAHDLMKDWTDADRIYLRTAAPRDGLQTKFRETTLKDIAAKLLEISDAGLARRGIKNDKGQDERVYLEPLKEIVSSGQNWSLRLMDRFNGAWKGNIAHLFKEMDYGAEPSVLKAAPAAPVNRVIILPAVRG